MFVRIPTNDLNVFVISLITSLCRFSPFLNNICTCKPLLLLSSFLNSYAYAYDFIQLLKQLYLLWSQAV